MTKSQAEQNAQSLDRDAATSTTESPDKEQDTSAPKLETWWRDKATRQERTIRLMQRQLDDLKQKVEELDTGQDPEAIAARRQLLRELVKLVPKALADARERTADPH